MGHIVFKGGDDNDDYRYGDQLAADVATYLAEHPSASVDEVVRAFTGKWSEDGIRHYFTKKRAEMLAAPPSSTLPEPMSNMKKLSPAQELALALLAEGVGYESSHTIHGKHRWIAKSTAESLVKLGYASFRRERANLDDLGGHGDKHPRIIEIADAGKKYVETHRVIVPRKEV